MSRTIIDLCESRVYNLEEASVAVPDFGNVKKKGQEIVKWSDEKKNIEIGLDSTYPAGYYKGGFIVRETDIFKKWIKTLKDNLAHSIINARIRRLSLGNKGDSEYVGDGVSELRIEYGPGYRVYYIQIKNGIAILLCGGDKSSQRRDIEKAEQVASNLEGFN